MKQQADPASAQARCEIRAPKPGDCDRMADLAGQLGYPSTGTQVRIRLDEMANSNHCAVCVAELPGGRIAGWIGMYLFRSVEQDRCAGISGLVVDKEFRSCEIGKILLGAAEEWARKQGCDAISVHTNVTRERAHRFYARNGYEHIKTQKYLRKSL